MFQSQNTGLWSKTSNSCKAPLNKRLAQSLKGGIVSPLTLTLVLSMLSVLLFVPPPFENRNNGVLLQSLEEAVRRLHPSPRSVFCSAVVCFRILNHVIFFHTFWAIFPHWASMKVHASHCQFCDVTWSNNKPLT